MHCSSLCSEKKQCTSLYWDIRPPSQQQYSSSFEGQRNKEFLSLLGLSGPLRSLSPRPFKYLWRRERKSSATHSRESTHTHLLKSTGLNKHKHVLHKTGHCSRCSDRRTGGFPKPSLECLWSSLIHKQRISVCICTEQEKTRPSPYEINPNLNHSTILHT